MSLSFSFPQYGKMQQKQSQVESRGKSYPYYSMGAYFPQHRNGGCKRVYGRPMILSKN